MASSSKKTDQGALLHCTFLHSFTTKKESVSGQSPTLSTSPAMLYSSPTYVAFGLLMLYCTILSGVNPRSEGELPARAAFRDTCGFCQDETESNSQRQLEQLSSLCSFTSWDRWVRHKKTYGTEPRFKNVCFFICCCLFFFLVKYREFWLFY